MALRNRELHARNDDDDRYPHHSGFFAHQMLWQYSECWSEVNKLLAFWLMWGFVWCHVCIGCKAVLSVWNDQWWVSEDRSSQSRSVHISDEVSSAAVAHYSSLHTCWPVLLICYSWLVFVDHFQRISYPSKEALLYRVALWHCARAPHHVLMCHWETTHSLTIQNVQHWTGSRSAYHPPRH